MNILLLKIHFIITTTYCHWWTTLFQGDQIQCLHIKYPYYWNDCNYVEEPTWPKTAKRFGETLLPIR